MADQPTFVKLAAQFADCIATSDNFRYAIAILRDFAGMQAEMPRNDGQNFKWLQIKNRLAEATVSAVGVNIVGK
jgi:hypothetical protein